MKIDNRITALTSLLLVNTVSYAAPSNEQLYEMLLGLKKEIADSKARETDLHTNLDKANAELKVAKKQLGALPKTELLVTAVKQLDETTKNQPPTIANAKEGFIMSAGALYVTPVVDSGNRVYPNSYMADNKINYSPGFQVSTAYQAKNNWDYTLNYKHFNSDNDVSNGISYYQQGTPITDYKTNYNMLDLEIGKLFSLSDTVSLRVSGGIRSTIMNENLSSSSAFNSITSGSSSSYPDYIEQAYTVTTNSYDYRSTKHNFWGLGPRITATPTWKPFGNNFQIFGNVGTSFIMGQQNDTYSGSYSTNCTSTSSEVSCGVSYENSYNDTDKKNSYVTMIEAGSGIGYTIKANLVDIDLKTGYQFEHWIVTDQTDNLIFRGFHGAYGTVGIKF